MVPPGTGPAWLMVRKDQLDEARDLIKGMKLRSNGPSVNDEQQ
jgi:hypothetical protein